MVARRFVSPEPGEDLTQVATRVLPATDGAVEHIPGARSGEIATPSATT